MEINFADLLIPSFLGMLALGAEIIVVVVLMKYFSNTYAPGSSLTKLINVV